MELIDLPEPLIEGRILSLLPWNDLLRFRRVSKVANRITTAYMREHPELAPEIDINERDRTFGAFMKMYIPTTKIFLNNESGDEFYNRGGANMAGFLNRYGDLVRSLRVQKISFVLHGNEMAFLMSLPNLRNFEARSYAVGEEQKRRKIVKWNELGYLRDPCTMTENRLPKTFMNLESIKIGEDFVVEDAFCRTCLLLEAMKNEVRKVSLPFSPYSSKFLQNMLRQKPDVFRMPMDTQHALGYAFAFIGSYILDRKDVNPDKPNLEVIDLACYHRKPDLMSPDLLLSASGNFIELCKVCFDNGVKLLNVSAEWFTERMFQPELTPPEVADPVISMINLNPGVLSLEMPNLECLKIDATSMCEMPSRASDRNGQPNWPSLKSLDVTVNGINPLAIVGYPRKVPGVQMLTLNDVYNFLFKGIRRLALTDLRLNFTANDRPVPKAENIVDSCPNLKKLTLVNWMGTNKSLLKLWEGLPGLEEITLEKCKNVGNVTFVGLDTKNPVFFKLQKLKKLSLKGLDEMPKITDLLFSMVIRHLNVTHFTITSEEPVRSVTMAGIRNLQEGQFATSIEKFPFQDWSLAGVSKAEFKKLETQFRSYEMI